MQDTPVLLLDEPDSALDYNNKHLLLDTVRSLCGNRERTVLLTMHDVNLAMQYCTRLVLLKGGELCGRSPAGGSRCRKPFQRSAGRSIPAPWYRPGGHWTVKGGTVMREQIKLYLWQ